MEIALTRLAEQIPVALLIIFFVILWTRDQNKQQSTRELARDEAQKLRDNSIQASMDKRDELMRQFWSVQQVSNREVLERLAASVEKVAGKLDEHDQKVDVAINRIEKQTTPRGRGVKA